MKSLPKNIDDWLLWQRGLNPQQIELGLDRLRPVAQRMNLLVDAATGPVPVITVAGTNGKGSTIALLEALSRCHGLCCASYTSPWLLRCNESVRIDAQPVSDETLMAAFERVEKARQGAPLTEFEFRTLAAVDIAFAHQPDVVLLEVGLGGRLDAVNLFDATVAIISSIALDHQRWLGDTREQIAIEKIGVARRDAVLVSAESSSHELLEPLARAVGAVPLLAQRDFCFGMQSEEPQCWWYRGDAIEFQSLPMPALPGRHQLANAAAAIAALSSLDIVQLDCSRTSLALREVALAGRLQHLVGAPVRFVDVAHNPHAATALAHWARAHAPRPITALCAMYGDKDLSGTVHAMHGIVQSWHLAPLPPPRGASAQALLAAVRQADSKVPITVHASISQAWRSAVLQADQGGCALAFGSFETVGEVLRLESSATKLDTWR
jgi:dihydrofolate synthase/folylpolyglutamate synthase